MAHFEIEVKSLLGEKDKADQLIKKMQEIDPDTSCISKNTQLNHYFEGGDVHKLYEKVERFFTGDEHENFKKIADRGKSFSVRSRQRNDEVYLVIKAAIDGSTSANSVKRMEFEELVPASLTELDKLIQKAGYKYQAKWSRVREEYLYKGANVCIDKNAGYGYLAEFEKIVPEESMADTVRKEIDDIMQELGAEELSQERLERMFDFYNQNWSDYYGTDKTFVIE